MPLIGSYSVVPTNADRYSLVDDLLVQLPDNTSNSIVAQDVRDAVYTLWKNIEDVGVIAASAASASSYFMNANATPVTVGGIPSGSTFPTNKTMQEMFDLLLYPYVPPGASLTFNGTNPRLYGTNLGGYLSWVATRTSQDLQTRTISAGPSVNTISIGPGSTSSNYTIPSGGVTHSNTPGVSTFNTFTMSVFDGTQSSYAYTSLTWMNNIYWGRIDLSGIGNPDLTTNPGSASMVGAYISNSDIYTLNGAGTIPLLTGSQLSTTKSKTYTGIDGAGKHLVFAWPSTVASPYTPTFTVNGLPNTAFTRVRTNSVFVNEVGFNGTNYEVWVSNTAQNSPLNIIIS